MSDLPQQTKGPRTKSDIPQFRDERKDLLTADMLEILRSGEGADITIRASGKEWKTHSFILKKRSSFFAAALKGPWQESKEGVIELNEEDATVVDIMLQFIYSGFYRHPEGAADAKIDYLQRAVLNGRVALAGDKYGVPLLEKFAMSRLIHNANSLKAYAGP